MVFRQKEVNDDSYKAFRWNTCSRFYRGFSLVPSCTQMLAWFGADVIKIERPRVGDVTRHQLRDIPDVDALYFTMLNSNKRSLELDTKTPEGKEVMEKLIRQADVLVENFHPGGD